MKKSILFGILMLSFVLPQNTWGIDYNKRQLEFGDEIYFNTGDMWRPEDRREYIDKNGYLYPDLIPYLEKGKFIAFETEPVYANGHYLEERAYIYIMYKKNVLKWPRIIQIIPEQRVVLLNW